MMPRFHAFNISAPALLLAVLFTFVSACAETEIPSTDAQDTGIAEDASSQLDVSETPDTQISPDIQPPEEDTRCSVCCPDEVRCSVTGVREVCNASGTAYVEDACPESQQCNGGICVDKQVCTPGEKSCYDTNTLLICRPTGTGQTTQACEAGQACINAECVSGQANAAQCQGDSDCAGGTCRCGDNDNCPGPWKPTYCTNECTRSSDCAGDEWCLAASYSSAPHDYNHCVMRCDQSCAIQGLACAHIPVYADDGSITWQQGCVHKELKSIGDKCTTDSECISGTCLEYFRDFKFCSRRCENDGCSDNSACVNLQANEYWCSLTCSGPVNARVCPLNKPTEQWGVGCKSLLTHGGNTAVSACAKTN